MPSRRLTFLVSADETGESACSLRERLLDLHLEEVALVDLLVHELARAGHS